MLAEQVIEWTQQWQEEGRRKGRQEGRAEERQRALAMARALLLRQTRQRFDPACAQALAPLLESMEEAERLADIGAWIVACQTGEELLAQVRGQSETS